MFVFLHERNGTLYAEHVVNLFASVCFGGEYIFVVFVLAVYAEVNILMSTICLEIENKMLF